MDRIRFGGLASGMDTESIVQKLMQAERMKYDSVKAKKQKLVWKQDMYREMNTSLSTLQSTLNKIRWEGSWSKYKLTSSNEAAISITNSGATSSATHTVKATKLAAYAQLSASPKNDGTMPGLNKLTGDSLTTPLEIGTKDKKITVNLGGVEQTITFAAGEKFGTPEELKDALQQKLNAAFGGNKIKAEIIDGALSLEPVEIATGATKPLTVTGDGENSDFLKKLGFYQGQSNRIQRFTTMEQLQKKLGMDPSDDVSFEINGQKIELKKYESVQDLIEKVNSSTAGVKLSYDEYNQTFSFISKNSGSDAVINITDPSRILGKLGFSTLAAHGEDAEFELDNVKMTRNSNTFTIDGLTYNLKEINKTVTVNAQPDTDALFNQIKEFMDKYNETIDIINKKLGEKTNRSFQPLTDEQKKEMKEKEIELWEEKAKSGLLKNDAYLSSALMEMRQALYQSVEGIAGFNHLSQIGIETSGDYKDKGKLVFKNNDETKLKEAIAKDPEAIAKLFSAKPTKESLPKPSNTSSPEYAAYKAREEERYKESGLVVRLYARIEQAINDVKLRIDNKGYETSNDTSIKKEITGIDKRLLRMEKLLKEKEDRYYKQFTAMEKALSKYNSQSSWLSSQFGMGQ